MTQTLVQKSLLHGTQRFELRGEFVRVTISHPIKGKKELDIELAMLNPEPVIEGSLLHFHSRVKCGPLISFYINKPNREEFDAFVEAVKAAAQSEYNSFSGLSR